MRTRLTVTAALAAAALAGCGSATTGSGTASSTTPVTPTPLPSGSASPTGPDPSSGPTVPPPADGSVPAGLADRPEVKKALADAAGRSGIVPGEVVIATYTPVTWSDGSLGCPEKGMAYTQMTVPGELLVLRIDQRTLEYHAGPDGTFAYCADPSDRFVPRTD